MSTYTVEKLPGEPIILASMTAEYSVSQDGPSSDGEIRAILDTTEEPLYVIVDQSRVNISLDDIIHGSSRTARGEEPLLHHQMIREFIFISDKQLLRLAAKGLDSATFGNLNIKVLGTVDEALAYIRSQIAM